MNKYIELQVVFNFESNRNPDYPYELWNYKIPEDEIDDFQPCDFAKLIVETIDPKNFFRLTWISTCQYYYGTEKRIQWMLDKTINGRGGKFVVEDILKIMDEYKDNARVCKTYKKHPNRKGDGRGDSGCNN